MEHDGCHFYLGLVRMGNAWVVSAHLLARPNEVNKYRVEITASNPKRRDRHVSYDGDRESGGEGRGVVGTRETGGGRRASRRN